MICPINIVLCSMSPLNKEVTVWVKALGQKEDVSQQPRIAHFACPTTRLAQNYLPGPEQLHIMSKSMFVQNVFPTGSVSKTEPIFVFKTVEPNPRSFAQFFFIGFPIFCPVAIFSFIVCLLNVTVVDPFNLTISFRSGELFLCQEEAAEGRSAAEG